jgi:hypothetical protein
MGYPFDQPEIPKPLPLHLKSATKLALLLGRKDVDSEGGFEGASRRVDRSFPIVDQRGGKHPRFTSISARHDSCLGGNRQDRAGRDMKQALSDAAQKRAGNASVSTRPDNDHVCVPVPRDIGDQIRRLTLGPSDDIEAHISAGFLQLLHLRPEAFLNVALVGKRGDATGASTESFVGVKHQQASI